MTVIYDPPMRRFIASLIAALSLIVAGLVMATPARAASSCPSGYGYFCFWNQSYFLGNRYVANYTMKGIRLGPYWNDRFFSWKNPGQIAWIMYSDDHCRTPLHTAYPGMQNSNNVKNGLYRVGSVSPIGYKGQFCS